MQQVALAKLETIKNNKPLFYGIIAVLIILVLWLVVRWWREDKKRRVKEPQLITSPVDSKVALSFPGIKIPNSTLGVEYTYTSWMYINNWNYKYGELKHIFHKGAPMGDSGLNAQLSANPLVMLYPKENKLLIRVDTVKNDNNPDYNAFNSTRNLDDAHTCDISNIPLQRWIHLSIVLWNLSLDVYIDGKLVRSCALSGVPVFNNGNLYVTQRGGFDGNIAELRYFDRALAPNEIYSMYSKGPNPKCAGLFGPVRCMMDKVSSIKLGVTVDKSGDDN